LLHEPTPANAPLFAADIARSALTISGVKLGYSPASLEQVDAILEDLGAGHLPRRWRRRCSGSAATWGAR
jgi:hypothetical protein